MPNAVDATVGLVGYLALFAGVGVVFLLVNLLVGRLVRPMNPHAEKLEIYECGEPTIGSSFVQFDLRFYVVALLFIIFDVEIAFFFPWGAVFGKTMHLADPAVPIVQQDAAGNLSYTPTALGLYRELGLYRDMRVQPVVSTEIPLSLQGAVQPNLPPAERASAVAHLGARQLAIVTLIDIGFFFLVLMVGFAYVWRRGDLDWVRHVSRERATRSLRARSGDPLEEEDLVGV
jgi:NADH-quinone oxidoreductase subunit A